MTPGEHRHEPDGATLLVMSPTEGRVVAAFAVVQAVAAAWLLVGLTQDVPSPRPFASTFAKALLLTLVFQGGLMWAPRTRGAYRWLAALLMVPGFLMFAGVAGESISKVMRFMPARLAPTAVSVSAVVVYAWVYVCLAKSVIMSRTQHR